MQINRANNSAVRPAAYKVQNVGAPDLTQAKNLPVAMPVIIQAAPASGPDILGGLLSGAMSAVSSGINWLLNLGRRQPELALPADTPAPKPVAVPQPLDGPGRRRLERIFDELDEDSNGRLEGDELNDNQLIGFDAEADAGMTRGDFVAEASRMDGMADVSLADVKAASLKAAIFSLMADVWGTDAYCNNTSFMWWKGQLKTVNGDMNRLHELMVNYKKSIEV